MKGISESMPLPLLHAVAGYTVYHGSAKEKPDWELAVSCIVLANAADLDFIPGILVGNPDLFHHSFTHSFTAAAVTGLLFALAAKIWKKREFMRTFLISSLAYSTHVALDFLLDRSALPLFWPLTPGKLTAMVTSFQLEKIHLRGFDDFVCNRFLSFYCLKRFATEMIIMGFGVLGFLVYSELKKKKLRVPLPQELR
ncbi:MAG TPA: metal-dependent hydrolase [bacterium]|nr:metal-dependent hydrolase [bacterium]